MATLFRTLFALVVVFLCVGIAMADYPYKDTCPVMKWVLNGDSFIDPNSQVSGDEYWASIYKFAQCNCTDYVSYRINKMFAEDDRINPVKGMIPGYFSNNYLYKHPDSDTYGTYAPLCPIAKAIPYNVLAKLDRWGDAKYWGGAAREFGIPVVNTPVVNMVAWWESLSTYGHVAFVVETGMNPKTGNPGFKAAHYNYHNDRRYSEEWFDNSAVSGFIDFQGAQVVYSRLTDYLAEYCQDHPENLACESGYDVSPSVVVYALERHGLNFPDGRQYRDNPPDCPASGTGGFGGDPGGGPVTPPPSTEPRNDLVPHVNAYLTTGDGHQVTADCATCPTEPVTEGQVLRVEQIMDSKYSDASKWFREVFHSIYTTAWFQIVSSDKTTTLVPWTEIFTRKFDPGRLEKDESYGESTTFTVPFGYPNHWLVIASCADPTDRVLEKNESTTRRSPAQNPDSCGTNNRTRKEWLRIQAKPKVFDYVIQNGGIINAPPYLWINETFRPWYEAVNQGSDTQEDRIAVSIKRIDPTNASILIQNRYIEPGTLVPNTVYLDQLGMNVIVYGPPGTHQLEFCINTEGKPESNTGNNCLSKPFEVRHTNMSYLCGLITPDTWPSWSVQPYGAPFDFFDGNRSLISPYCRKMCPSCLDMNFGKDGDSNVYVYKTAYIMNGKTGASTSFSVNCRNADLGTYCQGGAWLNISGIHVDTSSATQPTLILAYTCRLVNGQWKCGCKDTNCSASNWQQQAAGFVR